MTINRFEDAYAIVEEVNSPYVGVTLDQYHFYAMGSGWDTLEKADGKKIFVWHLNGTEDMPCEMCIRDRVKVMEIDDKGRVNLSMKDVKPEEKIL